MSLFEIIITLGIAAAIVWLFTLAVGLFGPGGALIFSGIAMLLCLILMQL
jgi:hypothetical protein